MPRAVSLTAETYPALPAGLEWLRQLSEDASVTDILINGGSGVFIERDGRLEPYPCPPPGEAELMRLAEEIARAVGRTFDPARPLLDARLPDGSRVNIVAPPLAVDGVNISIRRFPRRQLTLDEMAATGSVSPAVSEFLKVCARSRLNTVISGGTGSGKTTLLNAISQHIGDEERVVTIEDAAELRLQKRHVVRLETQPGGQVASDVDTRALVRNALRMRPDRIIVGEVRGAEAFDMIQAMNTGHEGSLTTIHANHPRDALSRLESIISLAGVNLPIRAIRGQIASAVHLVVQVSRMQDGVRRVTYISEIAGMEGDMVTMQELMAFVPTGEEKGRIRGEWRWTGIVPRSLKRIAYWGEMEHLSAALGMALKK